MMLRAFAIALITAVTSGAPSAAQQRRALSIDDFLRLRIAGDPQLSPDGAMVAFTVSTPSLTENRNVSRIWVLTIADGTTRELTGGAGSNMSPRWARDGKTLAFLSTRSGTPQVWRMRIDGGEPSQLTNLPNGVDEYVWSPDTTAVFAVADVKWPAED